MSKKKGIVTMRDMDILKVLNEAPNNRMGLSKRTDYSYAALWYRLKRLQEWGLIIFCMRTPMTKWYEITDKGRMVLDIFGS